MVAMDLGRAVLLGAIPLLYALDRLGIAALCACVFAFGSLCLFFDAANHSYVPQLVPKELLNAGYARVGQADAATGSTGPLLAGVLIKLVGAPLAVLVDAVSYLVSGLLLTSIRAHDPVPDRGARRSLLNGLREGVAWVYRHRTLACIALTSHLMLLFNTVVSTVFVVFALRDLKIGDFGLGVTYACAGLGGVVGGAFSARVARRFDVAAVLIAGRLVAAVGWLPLVLAQRGPWALVSVSLAFFLVSGAISLESPVEMSYRQAVTPERLRGRMNATIRSFNWGTVAIGAPWAASSPTGSATGSPCGLACPERSSRPFCSPCRAPGRPATPTGSSLLYGPEPRERHAFPKWSGTATSEGRRTRHHPRFRHRNAAPGKPGDAGRANARPKEDSHVVHGQGQGNAGPAPRPGQARCGTGGRHGRQAHGRQARQAGRHGAGQGQ